MSKFIVTISKSEIPETMKFDKYEWRILQELQKDGQLTNQDKVDLSPCW